MTRSLAAGFIVTALALASVSCSNNSTIVSGTTAPTGPVSDTFSGVVTLGGITSHTFNTFTSGPISVTLTGMSVPSTVVGLGLGVVYNQSNGICSLQTSLNTAPGTNPQISIATADSGLYCVAVYDVGKLGATQTFFLTVVHQ